MKVVKKIMLRYMYNCIIIDLHLSTSIPSILFLYCALEAYVTNNGTTIPSPVDIEAWRNSASGYQLNGCVRVSRVYTDSVAKVMALSKREV